MPAPMLSYTPRVCSCGKIFIERERAACLFNFCADWYSDVKVVTDTLPIFPAYSRCPNCKEYFWVDDLKGLKENKANKKKIEKEGYSWIEPLSIEERFEFLDLGLADTQNREHTVRYDLWHAYNDRIRYFSQRDFQDESGKEARWLRKKLWTDADDEARWTENAERLIYLYENEEPDEDGEELDALGRDVSAGELLRELGRFDEAIDSLQRVEGSMKHFVEDIVKAAEAKDRFVFKLDIFHGLQFYDPLDIFEA